MSIEKTNNSSSTLPRDSSESKRRLADSRVHGRLSHPLACSLSPPPPPPLRLVGCLPIPLLLPLRHLNKRICACFTCTSFTATRVGSSLVWLANQTRTFVWKSLLAQETSLLLPLWVGRPLAREQCPIVAGGSSPEVFFLNSLEILAPTRTPLRVYLSSISEFHRSNPDLVELT